MPGADRSEPRLALRPAAIKFRLEATSRVMMPPNEAWPAASEARPGASGSVEIFLTAASPAPSGPERRARRARARAQSGSRCRRCRARGAYRRRRSGCRRRRRHADCGRNPRLRSPAHRSTRPVPPAAAIAAVAIVAVVIAVAAQAAVLRPSAPRAVAIEAAGCARFSSASRRAAAR